ncbi:MAG: lipid A biosynthesis lauroyl acyltransferase [Gammaproteobacteria bacterium]|nr:lipid A biosynthesis lauroyl acyltransferase [Gammaproteobacteria bacterium]
MAFIKAVKPSDYLSPRHWPTWLGLALMRLMAKLPLPWIVVCGKLLGQVLYIALPSRRKIGEINLRIAFPDLSDKKIRQLNKICIKNIGVAAFELGLSWWEHERLLNLCEIEGLENLHQALEKNKGVIILTAHFTCLEIGGPVLNHHVPFQVMYKKIKNKLFDAFMRYHRSRLYKAVVNSNKPITLVKGLKKGYAAWYAPDQDFGSKETVFVPFFGVDATALTAPARFAKISGAPVVPYFIKRKAAGQGYTLTILPALENFPTDDNKADAIRINQTIEALIMQNPEQYLWVHKRYKNRPAGVAPIYPDKKQQ